MAKKTETSAEGMVITWALLIIIVCFIGSTATGTGPFEFLFLSMTGLFVLAIAVAVLGFVGSAFWRTWQELKKHDGRSLSQILKDEYKLEKLARDSKVVYMHVQRYASGYFWRRVDQALEKIKQFWEAYKASKN